MEIFRKVSLDETGNRVLCEIYQRSLNARMRLQATSEVQNFRTLCRCRLESVKQTLKHTCKSKLVRLLKFIDEKLQ